MEQKKPKGGKKSKAVIDRRTRPGARFDDADAIIKAAISCFTRHGVAKTSLADVAQEAGISRPLLYLFFPNRQALIDAVINSEISRMVELQLKPMRSHTRLIDAVVEGSCLAIELGRNNELLADLMEYSSTRHLPELLLDPTKPAHQVVLKLWQPVFEKARKSGELRKNISDDDLMEWLMSIHYAFLQREDITHERQKELITQFVVPALK